MEALPLGHNGCWRSDLEIVCLSYIISSNYHGSTAVFFCGTCIAGVCSLCCLKHIPSELTYTFASILKTLEEKLCPKILLSFNLFFAGFG